jgi:putative membrane protein
MTGDHGEDRAASRQRSSDLHAVVLLLAGGGVLRIAATGAYASYVKASARPYLVAASVVLLALAVVSLGQSVVARRRRHRAELSGEHGHGHAHTRFDAGWLLALPMAVLLLVAPKPAGAYEANRAGSALPPAPSSAYGPLPAGDPVAISVADFAARAVFDAGRTLTGRTVALTGFLTSAPGGGWYLTRMLVTCCAADAQPVKIGLGGNLPAGTRADEWMTVTGAYSQQTVKDKVNGATIPFLTVTSAQPVAQPADPYLS